MGSGMHKTLSELSERLSTRYNGVSTKKMAPKSVILADFSIFSAPKMCHFRSKVASLLASGSPNMNLDFNSKLRERWGTKLVWVCRLFHGPPFKRGHGGTEKSAPFRTPS